MSVQNRFRHGLRLPILYDFQVDNSRYNKLCIHDKYNVPYLSFSLNAYSLPIGFIKSFMKQIQCVLERLPDICPNIGFSGVSLRTSDTLMSVS
ncbi:hypothetical protein, partial [Barnesiella intestinihominis]|uniref:hypothetical protein n=1 Tax=Barnesiella intestinihominis TaxID=487174 RepID=UPI003F231E25